MSGVDIPAIDGHHARMIRKGSLDAIRKYLIDSGGEEQASGMAMNVSMMIGTDIALAGGTPLLCRESGVVRDHSAEGRRKRRHQGTLRATAGHGHSHGDDHWR